MNRRIHTGSDDDAVGKFGGCVTNTGIQLSIDGQPGALGSAVLTVGDVLRSSAIVCELYDVGFLTIPDLAHAFPQYLARGLRLGRVDEVSLAVAISGIWRASYWGRSSLVAPGFGAAACRSHVESELVIAALLARDGKDFGLRRARGR